MIALIIISVVIGSISVGCFVYAMYAFREKGPILMNEYILATSEEKRKQARMDPLKRKKDYHYVAKIFLCLSIIFFLVFMNFTLLLFHININAILMTIAICLALLLAVYVLITSIRQGEFR